MARLREHGTEIWKYLDEKHLEALEVSLASKTAALSYTGVVENWRIRNRLKISCVGLVLCLSNGQLLYEEEKPHPCSTLECWIDPFNLVSQRPSDVVSAALQAQYERWQPRAQYHLVTEPTLDDVHKLCLQLRNEAKDERVLFHYNGHGVPKPTSTGEIYLFSENFTHYVQLSLFELQSWLGTPSAYVFDCSNAGLILASFLEFAERRDKEATSNTNVDQANEKKDENEKDDVKKESRFFSDSILFASCGAEEMLPTNPYFPADIFTSCLTTPIQMAFRWFLPRSLVSGVRLEMLDRIPGKLNDKKTMLGELNWVFTAVTDCIAWNSIPRVLFHKLFRQDLLIASLFRNFLLAERILRSLNCTPMTHPQLPPMWHHPLWHAWDYMMELCLAQLPALLSTDEKQETDKDCLEDINKNNEDINRDILLGERMNTSCSYVSIPFFEHQLSAFETWLMIETDKPTVPEQLPIVLQVLLSQTHRKRALSLIARFLELGDWAVDLVLSVGVFPYILKLLQSPSPELRKELVFIWGKIICQDRSCVADLVREKGHNYMLDFLDTDDEEAYESQVMALFILSVASGFAPKKLVESRALDSVISKTVFSKDARVRRWSFLFLSKFMKNFPPIAQELFENDDFIRTILTVLRSDESPDNRASVLYFLEFLPPGMPFQLELYEDFLLIRDLGVDLWNVALGFIISVIEEKSDDASPLVRREVVKLTARTIKSLHDGDPTKVGYCMEGNLLQDPLGSFLLQILLYLSRDPQIEVSSFASEVHKDLTETSCRNEKQNKEEMETMSSSSNNNNNNNNAASSSHADIKSASLPRVVSLEGIAKQMEAFKIQYNNGEHETNNQDVKPRNDTKQSEHTGNAWRLPSLYDWSQGEIMNLRLSEGTKGGQSPQSIFESLHIQNKQMVYMPEIIDEGCLLSDDAVFLHTHHMESLQEHLTLDVGGSPVTCLKFSPMCSQLLVGTRSGEWSEWNSQNGTKLLSASCGNREISAMLVIGEAGGRITSYTRYVLLTGCSDSTIMLWRVDRFNRDIRMVFSCRCWSQFDDMEENIDYSKAYISKNFVMAWEPHSARIATNRRNPGVVRFWDLPQEICFARCRVPLDSCINSLTWTGSIANMGPQCLFGGTDNGSLFMIDMRTKNAIESIPLEHSTHNDSIVRVLGQASSSGGHLLSASKDGVVCVWDPRKLSTGLEPITILQLGQVEFIAAHTYSPVFACKTMESNVDIFNIQGDLLKSF